MSAGAADAEAQITPNYFGDALALARTTNPAIFTTRAPVCNLAAERANDVP